MTLPADVLKQFKEWGKKGGETRNANTTQEERSKIARKAAKAMWKKRKAKG